MRQGDHAESSSQLELSRSTYQQASHEPDKLENHAIPVEEGSGQQATARASTRGIVVRLVSNDARQVCSNQELLTTNYLVEHAASESRLDHAALTVLQSLGWT